MNFSHETIKVYCAALINQAKIATCVSTADCTKPCQQSLRFLTKRHVLQPLLHGAAWQKICPIILKQGELCRCLLKTFPK